MKVLNIAAQSALVLIFALSACASQPVSVMPMAPNALYAADSPVQRVVPNQVLLKFRKGSSSAQVQAFLKRYGGRIIKELPQIGVVLVELPSQSRLDRVMQSMSRESVVEYVEANSRISIDDPIK